MYSRKSSKGAVGGEEDLAVQTLGRLDDHETPSLVSTSLIQFGWGCFVFSLDYEIEGGGGEEDRDDGEDSDGGEDSDDGDCAGDGSDSGDSGDGSGGGGGVDSGDGGGFSVGSDAQISWGLDR